MTDINSLLFKIEMSPQIPSQGAILISEPFLREEYFCHAVISIVDYSSKNSAMGIFTNALSTGILRSIAILSK